MGLRNETLILEAWNQPKEVKLGLHVFRKLISSRIEACNSLTARQMYDQI